MRDWQSPEASVACRLNLVSVIHCLPDKMMANQLCHRIILRFVGLVYKFVDQAKYQKTRKQDYRARAAMTPALSQYSTGSSQSSAIDLTADDDYMSQGLILTPITSAAPSRPTSSHIPDHSQHQPPPAIFSQELASYGPTPFPQSRLPVLPDYVSPTVSIIPFSSFCAR